MGLLAFEIIKLCLPIMIPSQASCGWHIKMATPKSLILVYHLTITVPCYYKDARGNYQLSILMLYAYAVSLMSFCIFDHYPVI